MSAAHPTLPIPSYVRVRHLDNGRSVIVRVNDRGPFHSERLIDLSYTAAYKLGMLDRGRGLVEVESLLPPFDAAIDKPIVDAKAGGSDLPPNTVARPSAAATAPRGIYLQLGAFSLLKNAQAFVARLESELDWLASKTSVRREGRLFSVRTGPFNDTLEAGQAARRIRESSSFEPMIVTR
jgi:rare lipoprotein A